MKAKTMKVKKRVKPPVKRTFVIYSNIEEIYVTTKEAEAGLREKMVNVWRYNLDPDEGDFERQEITTFDFCVRIKPSVSLIAD